MRKGALIPLLLVCTLLVAARAIAQTGGAESKVALVIGNSAYPTAQLRNPVNDAMAMAGKLRALGFDVVVRTDANLREMTRAISQFGRMLKPGSVGLFYFAGHGVQVRGKNFLIPVDAEIDGEAAVRSEAIDVDQVLEQLGPARLSMVILDACRNNPYERRFRSIGGGGGLAQIDAPTGSLLAYATAPGKVAADGSGPNGLYTAELLKAMDVPGLKIEDVFKQVRINVLKASNNQQTPWESSSLTGEFFFRPEAPAKVDDGSLKQAQREQAELRRAVEDERRKREQDARALQQQLAQLQAELTKLRLAAAPKSTTSPATAPAPAGAPVVAVTPAPRQADPKPEAPAASASSAASSSPAASATLDVPALQEQADRFDRERDEDASAIMATLSERAARTAAPAAAAAARPKQWADRIALLEQSRGHLTYSKAVALLFDVSAEQELRLVVSAEQALRRMPWHSAYAMGLTAAGYLGAGHAWRNPIRRAGEERAVATCESRAVPPCRIIMADGEFSAADFLDVARRFGDQGPSVAQARSAYLKNIDAMLKQNRF